MNRNVYLPADLDQAFRALDLNLSQLVQEAVREAIEVASGRCVRCGALLPEPHGEDE